MKTNTQIPLNELNISDATLAFLSGRKGLFINGKFTPSSGDEWLQIENPATGCLLAEVACANEEDMEMAINAAKNAFASEQWAAMPPNGREAILRRLAQLMQENARTIAEIEALDAGKAISGCEAVDVAGAIDNLTYMAGWATKIEGHTRSVSAAGENLAMTLKEAVGVVAAIVPWNWPLSMSIWKIAAPLAVGCTIVLKPSELTPLSMLYVAELARQAGLPDGVLNIVPGHGSVIGQLLVSHPDVNKVSFTGSTPIGKIVGKAAIEHLAHVTLELGGKSPMIAFEDADIERIVTATSNSIFFNAGQVCSAGSRLYVHENIHDKTVAAIANSAKQLRIGDTLAADTDMGPLISKKQHESVLNYIEIGKQEGAFLYLGGKVPRSTGYYVEPTIFTQCTNDMRIVREEIFGPVLVVIPFKTEEEALLLANDNIFGLAASIFTKDISRALRCVKRLEAGTVWVNTHDMIDSATPFGGVKQSGLGKDMGPEQLDYFLETKTVWISV